MRPNTLIICLVIVTATITSATNLFAQDIDTLDWDEIVELADTAFRESLDTIYLLEDEYTSGESYRTGFETTCLSGGISMSINLNKTLKDINKGHYGINITGMFSPATLYEGPYSAEQWQWLSDLQPKTLRFPGGSSSKFMHLRPYKDANGDGILDSIKGYGYDILELIKYYDSTDDSLQIDLLDSSSVIAILNEFNYNNFETWLKPALAAQFFDFKEDFRNQEKLSPGDNYIDQFIRLVKKIETDNPGHVVDVIVCLNILTEKATDSREIVDYLRNVITNSENYSVNVVGVEMGNEVAGKFHQDVMKFDEFEDYWNYLDGAPVTGQTILETILGEPLFLPAADRNYFQAFKNSAGFNCKVGLCAEGLDPELDLVFFSDPADQSGTRAADDWNLDLYAHYPETFAGGKVRKFHAVILHTYYAKKDWEDDIVIGDTLNPLLDTLYTCPEWDFDEMDDRIQPAFDAARMNFRGFMQNRYMASMDTFNTLLHFNMTSANKKDMWITEYNFKDEGTDSRGKVFTNGFMHGCLLQEWWLKNLKLNYSSGYRENFFTYSTLQNYAGGSQIQMLTPADKEVELTILGVDTFPYSEATPDSLRKNYYTKRTVFHIMDLLSEIGKNDLRYFPATMATMSHNPNMFPTFFIDPAKEYIYMYYTNTRCIDQKYTLNPGGMYPLFLETVTLDSAVIHAIDAEQAYSTSGKSKLYDINDCYDPVSNPYDIEIDQTYTYPAVECTGPSGSLCVTVPGYTAGYVKIRVTHAPSPLRQANIQQSAPAIYPNPVADVLTINQSGFVAYTVYSISGSLVEFGSIANDQVNTSNLQPGMYLLHITDETGNGYTSSFIKL